MVFEDLEVWKRSAGLSADIYKELQQLKDYGFRTRLRALVCPYPATLLKAWMEAM